MTKNDKNSHHIPAYGKPYGTKDPISLKHKKQRRKRERRGTYDLKTHKL